MFNPSSLYLEFRMRSLLVLFIVSLLLPVTAGEVCYKVNGNDSCVKLCLHSEEAYLLFGEGGNETIPENATVSGECPHYINSNRQNMSTMHLEWNGDKGNDWLEFEFILNLVSFSDSETGAKHSWYLNNITYHRDSIGNYTLLRFLDFEIVSSDVYSYECSSDFRANLTNSSDYVIFSMKNYTVQAFNLNQTNFNFAPPDFCYKSGLPLYVPLIVGACLLVLLLVPLGVGGFFRLTPKLKKESQTAKYSRLKSDL